MTQSLSSEQLRIVRELSDAHGLDHTQISFDGPDLMPIFDYEAVCTLSLKLTDIAHISAVIRPSDPLRPNTSIATCTVDLADGRGRTVEDSADIGERLANGVVIETAREADGIAQNRAVRRGIRSVGVNLWFAHRRFLDTGSPASGHLGHDPRYVLYREIHALAAKIGLIVGGDKNGYEQFIAESFGGRISSLDLNDAELRQLGASLRAIAARTRGTVAV
jgi:hypothetical protein